jgi:hypothetical protein
MVQGGYKAVPGANQLALGHRHEGCHIDSHLLQAIVGNCIRSVKRTIAAYQGGHLLQLYRPGNTEESSKHIPAFNR